jgi:hypothetical protein
MPMQNHTAGYVLFPGDEVAANSSGNTSGSRWAILLKAPATFHCDAFHHLCYQAAHVG